jgi:hypothetical protein
MSSKLIGDTVTDIKIIASNLEYVIISSPTPTPIGSVSADTDEVSIRLRYKLVLHDTLILNDNLIL